MVAECGPALFKGYGKKKILTKKRTMTENRTPSIAGKRETGQNEERVPSLDDDEIKELIEREQPTKRPKMEIEAGTPSMLNALGDIDVPENMDVKTLFRMLKMQEMQYKLDEKARKAAEDERKKKEEEERKAAEEVKREYEKLRIERERWQECKCEEVLTGRAFIGNADLKPEQETIYSDWVGKLTKYACIFGILADAFGVKGCYGLKIKMCHMKSGQRKAELSLFHAICAPKSIKGAGFFTNTTVVWNCWIDHTKKTGFEPLMSTIVQGYKAEATSIPYVESMDLLYELSFMIQHMDGSGRNKIEVDEGYEKASLKHH
jgi:hypothetical protein